LKRGNAAKVGRKPPAIDAAARWAICRRSKKVTLIEAPALGGTKNPLRRIRSPLGLEIDGALLV
jgi:hypothetical protein